MDFLERLTDRVNLIPTLPKNCEMGYLDVGESFVVYPLPGSRVIREYMDGVKEQQLNFEFAMRSQSQATINQTLWLVQNELENLDDIPSGNESFEFIDLTITNKPYINQADDKGLFVFLLDIQAKITVFREEKPNEK